MIDLERLADLRAEVGDDGFAEVVALFLLETDALVARIAGGSVDPCRDLHSLRGSALNLGFRLLAQRCQDAERSCAAGSCPDLGAIVTMYEGSKAELIQTCGGNLVA